jgi:kynurenine formamidase
MQGLVSTSRSLWPWLAQISGARFIGLTHAFPESITHCESFAPAQRTTLYHHRKGIGTLGHGFLAHEYRHVGQRGTHVEPGAHVVEGKRLLDEIPVAEMMLPLVVLDIEAQVERDPDYCIHMDDVHAWECKYGQIPAGAFVAKRSGWPKRWPSQSHMMNRDASGTAHFPGWSLDVLRFVFEERRVTACGHETTDTDSGLSISRGDVSLERYVLERDAWQIELLASLADVPEAGAVVVASWPKPKAGAGFPARVFAIAP